MFDWIKKLLKKGEKPPRDTHRWSKPFIRKGFDRYHPPDVLVRCKKCGSLKREKDTLWSAREANCDTMLVQGVMES